MIVLPWPPQAKISSYAPGKDGHRGCRRGLDGLGKNPPPPQPRTPGTEHRNSRQRIGVSAIGESASQELAGAESQARSEPL